MHLACLEIFLKAHMIHESQIRTFLPLMPLPPICLFVCLPHWTWPFSLFFVAPFLQMHTGFFAPPGCLAQPS